MGFIASLLFFKDVFTINPNITKIIITKRIHFI